MQWLIDIIEETIQASFQGIIVAWSGAIVDIPTGWVLCDGTQGTPNLLDNFIIGAGDTYNPDDTGGAVSHRHLFTGDGHSHTIGAGPSITAGTGFDLTTSTDPTTGFTNTRDGRPPYYALAFIMKT